MTRQRQTFYGIERVDDQRLLLAAGGWERLNAHTVDLTAFRVFTSMTVAELWCLNEGAAQVDGIAYRVVPL